MTPRANAGPAAPPRPPRLQVRAAKAALATVLASTLLAACGSGPSGPTPRVLPDSSSVPSVATASAPSSATGTSASPVPATSPAGASVAVDQALLSFIPIGGHGLVLAVDPDTTAQVAQDPALRANATGLIIAVYTPDAASASAAPSDDIAVVSVVRLRDPSFDDAWFRDWRDSYDTSACANGGGVARNAETVVATHTVFIGSCAGGSFTYHTRIANGAIVISITSVGPARLGETIMDRLAP